MHVQVRRISQSAATQRMGRAGRTAPGICYRLYSNEEHQQMEVSQKPELLRSPLPLVVVNLAKLGTQHTVLMCSMLLGNCILPTRTNNYIIPATSS
jgi:HrpA-like RNA helicase